MKSRTKGDTLTRSQRHRQRLRENGTREITVRLSEDALRVLDVRCILSGKTRGEIITTLFESTIVR